MKVRGDRLAGRGGRSSVPAGGEQTQLCVRRQIVGKLCPPSSLAKSAGFCFAFASASICHEEEAGGKKRKGVVGRSGWLDG